LVDVTKTASRKTAGGLFFEEISIGAIRRITIIQFDETIMNFWEHCPVIIPFLRFLLLPRVVPASGVH
jgi:hypothetical protein